MNLPKTLYPLIREAMSYIRASQRAIDDQRFLADERDMKKLADWEGKLDGCLNRLNEIERELSS